MSALAILLLACSLCLAPVSAATVRGRRTAATPAVFNGPNGPEARWVIDENEKRAAVLPLNPELPE
jgi:hypothetical protein